MGKDTYMIAKQQDTGLPGLGNMRDEIIAEGTQYCAGLGQAFQIVSTQETHQTYVLGKYRAQRFNSCGYLLQIQNISALNHKRHLILSPKCTISDKEKSDEGRPIVPEHVYEKVSWRSTFGLQESMGQATTWSITVFPGTIGFFSC
jgi:hypothetical protein